MSLLDEREPTVSLKLIVAVVSFMTLAAFAGLWGFNAVAHNGTAPHAVETPASEQTGLL